MALTSRVAQRTMMQSVSVARCRSIVQPFTASPQQQSAISRRSSVSVRALATAAVKAPIEPKVHHPSLLSQAPPSMYAIIEVGGSQLFVEPGKWYTCNRLSAEPGSTIKFGRVLALKKDGQLQVGRPYLEDVTVEADIVSELRAPKVLVYKMRPKKHYRKMQGHRQDLTKFMISSIAQK